MSAAVGGGVSAKSRVRLAGVLGGIPRRPGGRTAGGAGREATHPRMGDRAISQRLGVGRALGCHARRQHENIFRQVVEQKRPTGRLAGDVLLRQITAEIIRAARERRAATPHAANNFIKSMRAFFAWAIENKMVAVDPTSGIKLLRGLNDEIGSSHVDARGTGPLRSALAGREPRAARLQLVAVHGSPPW